VDLHAAEQDFEDAMALVQDQIRDIAVIKEKQAAITAKGTAADGLVEVTVDAQRMVTKTEIDESYLSDFELAELGGHITTAAQQAAGEVDRQMAALFAPMTERRQQMPSLSGLGIEVPDLQDLISQMTSVISNAGDQGRSADGGMPEDPHFPTVRR
jgi:DNA-binding protein YbaB